MPETVEEDVTMTEESQEPGHLERRLEAILMVADEPQGIVHLATAVARPVAEVIVGEFPCGTPAPKRAGDGNRTRTKSLEGSCAAITPRPRGDLG